ncbi:oxygen-independent coproporphyrinogen-3 oxidase [Alkalispirochaeta americana]|uniref:Oxygen-independent coproporphyrinogen-3 oxidase n=1 Tax=Alkalispirochaeta americana TaxID=159291 RepID=A0A1N6Q670_9SPIO|nr:coproporphyrinogen-III oxidase family protein [Alkalispirochaeta americana]SIQ12113.1 oxygen-independent coproporphyrinogen-3 oxidase [Alkalispirochaeta americana]
MREISRRLRSHHEAQHAIADLLSIPDHPGPGHPSSGQRPPGHHPRGPVAGGGQRPGRAPLVAHLPGESGGDSYGAYFHVPFCDRLCSFCNLNREKIGGDPVRVFSRAREYAGVICSQLEECQGHPFFGEGRVEALYFGGGTPTVLSPEDFSAVLSSAEELFRYSSQCEITVETTLHNLDGEMLDTLVRGGVNRLSLGVQTFSDQGRKVLARSGDGERAFRRVAEIRKNFPGTLSIDLIYSYPGQTLEHLEDDARRAIDLGVDSVSFYSLMLQKDSPLEKSVRAGAISFDRTLETEEKLHRRFLSLLYGGGYELRELTKVVLPGRDAYRYIDLMYGAGSVLPFGTGAGGRVPGKCLMRPQPGMVMVAPRSEAEEAANRLLGTLQRGIYRPEELVPEILIMARTGGLSLEKSQLGGIIRKHIERYRSEGLMDAVAPGEARLTERGVFWGNNIAVDLLRALLSPEASFNPTQKKRKEKP